MSDIKDEYYKKVESWLHESRRSRFARQNTRHPMMMYLRSKADDKYKELYPQEKSVFDENLKPNRNFLLLNRIPFKVHLPCTCEVYGCQKCYEFIVVVCQKFVPQLSRRL